VVVAYSVGYFKISVKIVTTMMAETTKATGRPKVVIVENVCKRE